MSLTLLVAPICLAVQGTSAKQSPYKPYAEVITSEAKSQDGMFKVHQIDEKFYFEIPKNLLERDMLWQAQEASIPLTMGSPGIQANRLVRWSRRGTKIYLKGADYTLRAKGAENQKSIDSVAAEGIIAAFKVETEGAGSSAVIDVSDFLISDPNDLNIAPSWNASLQRSRSYVDKVKAFPENVEMRSLLTFQLPLQTILKGTDASYGGTTGPNASVLMHYSFALLPEKPMMPRYRDPRVGYFGILIEEFGGPENRSMRRELIRRFRLEKKDPSAKISEPVKPIVFYIAREWPKKWRPYVKKGVEAWLPAFEQAGFKNAIVCKEAPTEAEDPDWDQEDARHSMIRWSTTFTENAFGLQIADPRSGEVVSGQVVFYHNFLAFLQNMYFAQASPLDPAARKMPFNEALMGKLVQYVMTHEIGHAIGLEHNMKASSMYSIAQLRDPAFVEKNDIAASIMDYARFNYVSQPGDGVTLKRGIGHYDKFAIEWGYKPIPSAATPEQEGPALDAIASRQNTNPFLRFGNYVHPEDPASIGEDISNDTIEAARLGFLNLRRASKLLVPATVQPGTTYRQMAGAHAALVVQYEQLLDNVIRLVGGVNAADHNMMSGGLVYEPVPAARQRAAVKFMCGSEGVPPAELLAANVAKRLFVSGDINRAMSFQNVIVFSLFSETRIKRMLDQEAVAGKKAYTVKEMLEDVQNGVWRQLAEARPKIDAYQRQYQRGYLTTLDGKLNGSAATKTDLLPLGRSSLQKLARRIDKALPRSADEMTALHLQDCRRQIEAILNGTSPVSKAPPAATPARTGARTGARSAASPCLCAGANL